MADKDSSYGKLSQWRDTAALSAEAAAELAARLELRAKASDEAAAREEYVGLLGVAPGERVLDIGCGSGVVSRAIAKRVAPGGRVFGIDSSEALLEVARQYAAAAHLGSSMELRRGDCRALPFDDGSFDATVAATVFAHVPGVEAAIDEMIRVTRPGGRVGVFDFDGDCFLISHPDRHMTRRVVAAHADHSAVNSRLVRALPGLLADRGIVDVQTRGFMPLEREPGSFYATLAERAGHIAAKVGAISASESAGWLEQLQTVVRENKFLGGRLHVFVWGTRASS